jgi:predicted outer membrane protein
MKRFTFDVLLAGTLALSPAAWAQNMPGTGSGSMTGADAGSLNTGSNPAVPGPAQRRDQNTTAPGAPAAPETPEAHGRNGYPTPETAPPSGVQPAPDTTNTGTPAPTDTTRPMGGSPSRTDERPGSTRTDVPPITDTPPATSVPTTGAATAGAEGDVDVIAKVHQANQKEIEMAQMALDKAESPRVKSYARKLLNDHQAADKKLLGYAEKKSVDLSKLEAKATDTGAAATAASEDDAHRRLQNATGTDFDREFVNVMLAEHDKAIDLVKSARDSVTDKQLRSQLSTMLPKLEQHRKMARDLSEKQSKS